MMIVRVNVRSSAVIMIIVMNKSCASVYCGCHGYSSVVTSSELSGHHVTFTVSAVLIIVIIVIIIIIIIIIIVLLRK